MPSRDEIREQVLDAIEGHYMDIAEGLPYTARELAEKSVTFRNLMQLIDQQNLEARIDEHSQLWSIVPPEAEHVGTVRDISDLRVIKLKAQLSTKPLEREQ